MANLKYAGFWWRFLAYLIDAVILWFVNWNIVTPLLAVLGISVASTAS